jgi:hypothetical protein
MRLIMCPYFEMDCLRGQSSLTLGGTGRLQALIVAQGHGRFSCGEYVLPGDVWVLPAAMDRILLQIESPLRGVLATLP